jgi:hypothetical protein
VTGGSTQSVVASSKLAVPSSRRALVPRDDLGARLDAAAAGLTPDAMAQLQSLGELHQQGVLTDEEFAAAKAKLLGG